MTAAIALLLMASGAGLVAGQGAPPGTTTDVQTGWAMAASGLLLCLVAAVRSDRADRRADRAAAQEPEWFWAPLVEPDEEPVAGPATASPARSRETVRAARDSDRVRKAAPRSPRPA
jgi:hypothetical protein